MLIVHTPEDVRCAHVHHSNIEWATPADFCCYAGTAYGLAMQQAAFPHALLLGCGADAAVAHDALRIGITRIYTACAAPMVEALRSIASELGATITEYYPPACIDMRN